MSVSQFTVFSSSDPGGPGLLFATAGTLLSLLDACLTGSLGSGYPIANAAALGWTKPFANSGNIGCYKQPAGAGLGLVINDNGPNGSSTFKEAWATGWETIASIASPVGTGTGQFPTPAQLNTTGQVVVRKCQATPGTGQFWLLFADTSTFYLFISTGDTPSGVYHGLWFGDVFSLAGSTDKYRCILVGNTTENSNAGNLGDSLQAGSATGGHYMARTWGGTGASIAVTQLCDMAIASASGGLAGLLQAPNGPDSSFYLSSIRIAETTPSIRGRLRGLYMVGHPASNFSDGQTFAGGGDFAGKTFRVVKFLCTSASVTPFVAVETSNTVETN